MTKIFINPGHDIDLDSGAVNLNTGRRECDVARDAGKLLACYLQTAGYEVRTLQNDDLGLVCETSNEWGADIFVSLHCNAFNTQARGTETLYKSFNGQRLANDIQSQIIRSINTVDRGVKERQDLWVLNGTDATAVLVEMAFIDNDEDLALFVSRLSRCCFSIRSTDSRAR